MKLVRSIVRGFGTVKYQVGAPVAPPCANESTEKAKRNVSARKNKLPLTRICLACNGFVEDSITMTPCFCRMKFCLLDHWITSNCHQPFSVLAARAATPAHKGPDSTHYQSGACYSASARLSRQRKAVEFPHFYVLKKEVCNSGGPLPALASNGLLTPSKSLLIPSARA